MIPCPTCRHRTYFPENYDVNNAMKALVINIDLLHSLNIPFNEDSTKYFNPNMCFELWNLQENQNMPQ